MRWRLLYNCGWFLELFWKNFILFLSIFIKKICLKFSFFVESVWNRYQSDCDLIEFVWWCSCCFYFMEYFEKFWYYLFIESLVLIVSGSEVVGFFFLVCFCFSYFFVDFYWLFQFWLRLYDNLNSLSHLGTWNACNKSSYVFWFSNFAQYRLLNFVLSVCSYIHFFYFCFW